MNLQLSLKTQWFNLTKEGIKTEDYRDINEYWARRFVSYCSNMSHLFNQPHLIMLNRFELKFKDFEHNIMTLGYPNRTHYERILKYKHEGITIGYGKEEWGAEPNKLYFIIKHGEKVN